MILVGDEIVSLLSLPHESEIDLNVISCIRDT